jgi:hypothetical protein
VCWLVAAPPFAGWVLLRMTSSRGTNRFRVLG